METCSVCNEVEEYCRGPNVHYICGGCVQILLVTDQQDLYEAYHEAKEEGDRRYMWAMRVFMFTKPSKIKMVRKI